MPYPLRICVSLLLPKKLNRHVSRNFHHSETYVTSEQHSYILCTLQTSVLSTNWLTLVRGAQTRSNDDGPLHANLLPMFYSVDQLAFMCRHGLIRLGNHVNPSHGVVYFRATRSINPGEELMLQWVDFSWHLRSFTHPPINPSSRPEFIPSPNASNLFSGTINTKQFESGVQSEPHRPFEFATENSSPRGSTEDEKPALSLMHSSTDCARHGDTSVSILMHRLFSTFAQNGGEGIHMVKNLTRYLKSNPVTVPEQWNVSGIEAPSVCPKTRPTLTERFTNSSGDRQYVRPGMDAFNPERHTLSATPSSSANRCFETAASQLRPAHAVEPEESESDKIQDSLSINLTRPGNHVLRCDRTFRLAKDFHLYSQRTNEFK